MKKLLLISAVLMQVGLFGQAVPNGGFETWNTIPYNDPTGFNTGNPKDVQKMGLASVTKVTGFAGSAVHIQVNTAAGDTSDSYMINTANPCNDPPNWIGGVPYSQQPTAITGKFRYNLMGNDTAILIVIFRKNGSHIGDNYIMIRGTGVQSTFASFSYTVNCAGVPDSLIIAAAPADKKSTNVANNGSYIEFDNLAFTGASQIIPNGDFETWTAKTYDAAVGWDPSGNSVTRTTSFYAGAYAMRLETKNDCGGVNYSGITSGKNSSMSGPKGGRPFTSTIDTLCGYYKYTSFGNDTASVYINLSKNGLNVGGNSKKLKASATYTYFEVPFNSGLTPDTMRVDIQSSKWPTSVSNAGSVLYVDNLYLKSSPLGIFENHFANSGISAFPNPAKDVLFIRGGKDFSPQNLIIFDAVGKSVKTQETLNNLSLLQIDVADLSVGMYYYEIKMKNGSVIRNKFVKE